jgi:plasmid stability protein
MRIMAEIVLTGVSDSVYHRLQERATLHQRTPEEEAKAILSDVLKGKGQNAWAQVDAIYGQLASAGRTFSDSAELLREDRDR